MTRYRRRRGMPYVRPNKPKKVGSELVALWEATELLRDLASAVEWLIETKPEAATFQFERRRVMMHLEDVREFVRGQDA
jgi:hypothetical protein